MAVGLLSAVPLFFMIEAAVAGGPPAVCPVPCPVVLGFFTSRLVIWGRQEREYFVEASYEESNNESMPVMKSFTSDCVYRRIEQTVAMLFPCLTVGNCLPFAPSMLIQTQGSNNALQCGV